MNRYITRLEIHMGTEKNRSIRDLESIVNRKRDLVNHFLATAAQPPARDKSGDKPKPDHMLETLTRGTGERR